MLTATAPATTLSATDRSYLPALTGLRAVAAYLVFLHHFNPFAKAGPTQVLYRALLEFHIGVPIFFVLSGFLITLRYSTTVQWTWSWWGQYLRNRVARIYPLFFLMTCISFAWIYSTEGSFHVRVWLLNVLFLRGFFSELIYSGLSQGWTLTVEECFYLFAPLAFWLRTQGKVRLWLLPFALLALGCALVLLFRPLPLYGLFGNFKFSPVCSWRSGTAAGSCGATPSRVC
jgi:peptidoglycan/LPS O-acetylase OafA/YrhL